METSKVWVVIFSFDADVLGVYKELEDAFGACWDYGFEQEQRFIAKPHFETTRQPFVKQEFQEDGEIGYIRPYEDGSFGAWVFKQMFTVKQFEIK